MRIVIDMQGAQTESRFRGIGRYTLSLAHAIVHNRGEHEIILALSGLFPETIEPIRAAFNGFLPQENIRVWYALGPIRESEPDNKWRREVAERVREAFLASLQPDVVHVLSLFEGYIDDAVTSIGVFAPRIPTVVTLYDLIPLLNPEIYLQPGSAYAQYYQRKIKHLKHASQWLAISKSAAGEGREALALPADAVIDISTACDAVFRCMEITEPERLRLLAQFGITRPFILYSGGADARKNLHRLIRAYTRLPMLLRDAHQLVLAGKMPAGEVTELRQTAKTADIREGQLVFTGYVPDEDLARFYNLCTVFVLPSCHEGFGLPALEAMSCGAAVIGADTTSIPEVIGRQDALFDPYDETAISQKLAQALGDAAFRTELAAHGLEQAKKFSWNESARRAMAAFEKLHSVMAGNSAAGESKNILFDLVDAIATVAPSNMPDAEMLKLADALSHIYTDNAPKQLLVDISELVQRDSRSGVQRVTRSILKELLESPPEGFQVEPVYAMVNTPGYRYARQFSARFRGAISNLPDEPIDLCPGDIFLGLDLQHQVAAAQKEYLTALRRDGVVVFFVVYDLLPVLMPHVFPSNMNKAHDAWLETLMGFDGAVCISRAVADELAAWQQINGPQGMRPFRNTWFHLGADIENSVPTRGLPADANQVVKDLALRPTFLMVGTLEPRKGQAQALCAFEQLWRQGVKANLVIVGKQGWMVEQLAERLLRHAELNKHLFWLEGISDEYLDQVYATSTCLIAASEGEGFGLPLIEAAQHKLPIIARDIPVFREVAGEHAYYFKGAAPGDLAQPITEWLRLYKLGQHPKSDNLPWLTWKQSAQQLLKQILPQRKTSAS